MRRPSYWLKMVGAADDPIDNRWIEAQPELLREVRSPWRPSRIKRGDVLVYFAAGDQRLFAVASSKVDGEDVVEVPKKGVERWPYLIEVQVRLAIPTLQQSPKWDVLGIASASVQQKSYIELTAAQYQLAWEALAGVAKP